MDNPGPFQLGLNGAAFSITSAGVQIGDWVGDLDGMLSASLQAQFEYGSGGSSATLFIQTSLDGGATPIDIAAIAFTTANATKLINLSALTPKTTPADAQQQALTPGTCLDGILGDRLRAVLVSTGTYGSSTGLNITGIAR